MFQIFVGEMNMEMITKRSCLAPDPSPSIKLKIAVGPIRPKSFTVPVKLIDIAFVIIKNVIKNDQKHIDSINKILRGVECFRNSVTEYTFETHVLWSLLLITSTTQVIFFAENP